MKPATKKFVNVLQAKSLQFPHLRVGQLIDNAIAQWHSRHESRVTMFYMKDQDLIDAMSEYNP